MNKKDNFVNIFDTSIASLNVGDYIIMDAVTKQLSTISNLPQTVTLPTHDHFGREGRRLLSLAKYSIVGGTNLLSSHVTQYRQWRFRMTDLLFLKKCILMGVGWWQYQDKPDRVTKFILKHILHNEMLHSVRDSFTLKQLHSIGITNVINTGCPTMWDLTPEHCCNIPREKGRRVLFTLTDYNQDLSADALLINTLKRHYDEVLFWPQGSEDIHYMNTFSTDIRNGLKILRPSLSELNANLMLKETDYVGTRLHAGIRALQLRARTIIIGVDNRAIEKAKDFNLPVLKRDAILGLENMIVEPLITQINMPWGNIEKWKDQF
ncbi:TPA: polysaccharide pyruvyl transferase family protein [Escherichia coli]|nr:polysaccharide pyruvyl transferase family protein [Escherichia coli]